MKRRTYVEKLDVLAMQITQVWSVKARNAYSSLLRALRKLDKTLEKK